MYNVEIPEGQSEFAELLRRVRSGEEIIISQAGTPIARIVPIAEQKLPRIPGLDRGKVTTASDFDAPLPDDVLNAFLNPTDEEE
ncbi:type II toxin-antitoxin system Phd/YefM family antitoxin [Calothrix sp. PCC 6303]|uniref:type II toxin-antitoxin system Phd/YefM family antitoxin n=1 Tax=Calothrix sp. PCC 6303 TaxID=1170562 RepID=UPI0002A0086E|nr:type II toxin-antitoxin system Phd/YefM family antitoxin [Calothrix sp. PCC 6303]AFZ01341.1 prevent-host-death family protein [Calothrix sp. PCC 6303]NJR19372.1 type II toxin-antitoxin system Phd/YefM family antitoxin [Calothrix sp. CSU_2_0]